MDKTNKKPVNSHELDLRNRNSNYDFTLISQDCFAGVVYSMLGLKFQSPTINLVISGLNFCKFVENLEYYLSLVPKPVTDKFQDPKKPSKFIPKISLGGIDIFCTHYQNCSEAIEAWERRKARVNLDNVFVYCNSWDMNNDKHLIERVLSSKYKSICLANVEFESKQCIKLKGDQWKPTKSLVPSNDILAISDDGVTRKFEQYFDVVDWLNGGAGLIR